MPSIVAEAKSTWRELFFPTKTFGNKQRFKLLHYDEENDKAHCFECIKAIEKNNMSGESAHRTTTSDSFVRSGHNNWKKALEKGRGFERHEKPDYH